MIDVLAPFTIFRARLLYHQGWLIERMRYVLLNCDGSRSNRDTGRCQKGPKTRLDFWCRSRSIPIDVEPVYREANHATKEAHLICWLGLQLLENLLRLGFGGRAHGEAAKTILYHDVVWQLVQAGRSRVRFK